MRASLLVLLLLTLSPLAVAAPFPVTATPARVVLGRDKAVVVQVKVPRGTPPLRAVASTGSLLPLPATARGEYAYRWIPPDIRYPLLAVLAFWVDSPEGPPEVTTMHVPLLGRTTLDVATDVGAGAEVVVQVADMRFGPVRTNRKGRAQVQVEVPPGVREARVLATAKGQQTDRTARLDVPPEQPLLALISPDVLTVNGAGWLVVLGEQPMPGSELNLQVQGGSVEEQAQTPGVFRVKPEPEATAVVVDAHRKDGTGAARVTVPVTAPIVAHVPPPQPPPVVAPPPVVKPPEPPVDWRTYLGNLSVHLMAGGFLAGGDNRGPLASVGLGYRLPPLGGRFALEVESGLRQSVTHPLVEPLGPLDSRVVALPLLLSARVLAFERGPLSLHGRVGAGVTFYEQRVTSSFFTEPRIQQGRTFMGFVAAQAAWRFGSLSALFELRGSYAAAQASEIDAQLGGVSASLGVRYAL
ncbi:hypothetical protein [Vitiosangium sp. GDMCC 1.1324]|uniref:hypothetical protein n=1 Tax=Vitiosangium sp. (strain GDMCC 1.1324) TaxID=2138576 RepID=UPI000D346F96|nr:hypothetical protein [Vitiosangium sp. GDMCC 1.1324]PTL80977.1 hypothetical protein DAT35_27030 [Vitiosangium sp. GDMCC 1.1324]